MQKIILNILLAISPLLIFSACDTTNNTNQDKNASVENILATELLISNSLGTLTDEFKQKEKNIQLITTQSKYTEISIIYDPKNSIEDLNFSKGNVLLIDIGISGMNGPKIITKTIENNSSLLVDIEYCYSLISSAIITHPYQLIWIPSKKEIQISETDIYLKKESQTCQ